MKKISFLILLASVCFLSNSGLAYAEIKTFLHIDGIEGEATNSEYPNWIEILTWEWQRSQPGLLQIGGGGGYEKAIVRPLIVEKPIDKASVELFIRLFNGVPIAEAVLALQQSGTPPHEVLRIKMTNVSIVNLGSFNAGVQAAEQVALAFEKVCYKYTPLKPDGTPDASIEKCWDIGANVEP